MELARNSSEEHPTQLTKESLIDWKNALSLVLSNRSNQDSGAIQGLGDQLRNANSIDEAYIW